MEKRKNERVKMALLHLAAVAGVAIVIYSALSGIFGHRAVSIASAQSDTFLARRIDQIENRFYSLESSLNRLEQDTRRPAAVTPQITGGNDLEIQFLRSQVDALRTRLGEAECGLLRIDERTLTAAARAARKKGLEAERCRRNPATPIELSARP